MNKSPNSKIPVGILGATGVVGQRFVELLAHHPWFEIVFLAASEKSAYKPYKEAVNWLMTTPLPAHVASMTLKPCKPDPSCKFVFSSLSSSVAGEIEAEFAKEGITVVTNARNHRMEKNVPLLVPEVNASHLALLKTQTTPGKIVTNPNCSTIGLTIALKPLSDLFGIEAVHVVTMQAISGAGYPGVSSFDILDNVIPFIRGEEQKIETESLKILGSYEEGEILYHPMKVSAQCNRVAVSDGHLLNISVKLKRKACKEDVIEAFRNFTSDTELYALPLAPKQPIYYLDEEHDPQPKKHRYLDRGMAVSVGRLRECPLMDYKFVALSHNTIRGAAGGAILNAELMTKLGIFE